MAMLVGERIDQTPIAIVVVEDDAAAIIGQSALAALRKAGIAADIVATGSPRKRFDKANKLNPAILIVADMHDGLPILSVRKSADGGFEAQVRGLIDPIYK